MHELVTFDFHNTLADCDPWFYLEIRDLPANVFEQIEPDLIQQFGRDEVIARYRTLRQGVMSSGREIDAIEGVSRVASELGITIEREAIEESVHTLMRTALDHVTPIPGAIDAIHDVRAEGIPVGVISSAVYHPFLEWSLDQFGLRDDLAFIVTSASSGHYKSNPEIYRYSMAQTGADPARSIHIGDSPKWDVWGAQQAGMRAVWFSNGETGTMVDRDHESEPDYIVHAMSDVAPWVLKQLGATGE